MRSLNVVLCHARWGCSARTRTRTPLHAALSGVDWVGAAARLEIPWFAVGVVLAICITRYHGLIDSAKGRNHMRSPITIYINALSKDSRCSTSAGCCCELSHCELSHRRLPSGGFWYATFYSVDSRMGNMFTLLVPRRPLA